MSKVLVLGYGKSGKGAVKLLNKLNISVDVYVDNLSKLLVDKNDKLVSNFIDKITDSQIKSYDFVVTSPGFCSSHKIIKLAIKNNVKLISEIELGYLYSNNIVAITGTNGKSTTSKLIENLLKRSGENSVCCGNFGYSFCEAIVDEINRTFVVETSSFQLEHIDSYQPKYIILTNISKDHLNRYNSYEEYISTKKLILKNYKDETIIANYDDKNIRDMLKDIRGNIYYFSLKQKTNGAYLDGDYICINILNKVVRLMSIKDLYIDYPFEIQNSLAVITFGLAKHLALVDIIETVKYFDGLKHRLEYVKQINGTKYYNNSKCTNIASCLESIKAIKEDCLLILGGSSKNECFEELFSNLPNNVKHIAICGDNANSIIKNSGIYSNICKIYPNIESILDSIKDLTDIQAVLYSPSSASFDKYSCSEERGKVFCELLSNID